MHPWRNADFRSKAKQRAADPSVARRTTAQREMVSGLVSQALHRAIKARAAERKQAVYKLVDEMNIGASTYARLRGCLPIAQTTVLKIVTFLGTSVPAVMAKQHRETK